jgi:hypothetical protein
MTLESAEGRKTCKNTKRNGISVAFVSCLQQYSYFIRYTSRVLERNQEKRIRRYILFQPCAFYFLKKLNSPYGRSQGVTSPQYSVANMFSMRRKDSAVWHALCTSRAPIGSAGARTKSALCHSHARGKRLRYTHGKNMGRHVRIAVNHSERARQAMSALWP